MFAKALVTAAAGKGPLYDEKFDEGLWGISSARFGGFIPGKRLVVGGQQLVIAHQRLSCVLGSSRVQIVGSCAVAESTRQAANGAKRTHTANRPTIIQMVVTYVRIASHTR